MYIVCFVVYSVNSTYRDSRFWSGWIESYKKYGGKKNTLTISLDLFYTIVNAKDHSHTYTRLDIHYKNFVAIFFVICAPRPADDIFFYAFLPNTHKNNILNDSTSTYRYNFFY